MTELPEHSEEHGAPNSIIIVAGPTASGKSREAIRLAKVHDGEVISVDSRQVYRRLDIGTEKMTREEMGGVPHHLIDIREPSKVYTAGEFVIDAKRILSEIHSRGKMPIFAGGTHFYYDALLYGLPEVSPNPALRAELDGLSNDELLEKIRAHDARRASDIDPANRRRLIRALEIITERGQVPVRGEEAAGFLAAHPIIWVIINPPSEELRTRISTRLEDTLARGLIDEVARIREEVGDARLNELGLEYRIVGEYLRGECDDSSLLPTLQSKLWQYARRQKAWLRKLSTEFTIATNSADPTGA